MYHSRLVMVLVFSAVVIVAGCGDDNGDDGDDDELEARHCQKACEEASDCGWEEDNRCEDGICIREECEIDDDCISHNRGWGPRCESAEDCPYPNQVCVEQGDEYYCANPIDEDGECPGVEAIIFEGQTDATGGEVDVCGVDLGITECRQGGHGGYACAPPDDNDDNDDSPSPVKCDDDADCDEFDFRDACFEGSCVCSDDDVCADGWICVAAPGA